MQSLPLGRCHAGRPGAGRHGAGDIGSGRAGARRGQAADPGRSRRAVRALGATVAIVFMGSIVLGSVPALAGAAPINSHEQRAMFAASTRHGPMFGASILNKATLKNETAEFGHMAIVHVYYTSLPKPNAWTSGKAAANHSAVIVSFFALPKTILSGADNAALSHFFDTAPRGHQIYYSYVHEPERQIKLGKFTLAAYKKAWVRVAALARAAHNPYLHSILLLEAYDLTKPAHRDWRTFLPGGHIISTLGWDAYPVGSALNKHPRLTPPADFMGPAIAASKRARLPFGFAEFGLSTPKGRPGWLRRVGNYLLHSGARFATLFDGDSQRPFLKLTDRASIRVWRSFVSRSSSRKPAPPPVPGQPTIRITGVGYGPARSARAAAAAASRRLEVGRP
jgi:hypothetical protein